MKVRLNASQMCLEEQDLVQSGATKIRCFKNGNLRILTIRKIGGGDYE